MAPQCQKFILSLVFSIPHPNPQKTVLFLVIFSFDNLGLIQEDFSHELKVTTNYLAIPKKTIMAIGMFDEECCQEKDAIFEYIARAKLAEMEVINND